MVRVVTPKTAKVVVRAVPASASIRFHPRLKTLIPIRFKTRKTHKTRKRQTRRLPCVRIPSMMDSITFREPMVPKPRNRAADPSSRLRASGAAHNPHAQRSNAQRPQFRTLVAPTCPSEASERRGKQREGGPNSSFRTSRGVNNVKCPPRNPHAINDMPLNSQLPPTPPPRPKAAEFALGRPVKFG